MSRWVVVLAVEPALRRDACFVCGILGGLLTIAPGDALVCPPCAVDVARLLANSSETILGSWFFAPESEPPGGPTSVEATFAKFLQARRQDVPADDAQTFRDLAVAFTEMGCYREAVRFAATAIVAEAPAVHPTALRIALLQVARKPGCLAGIASAIQAQRGA